MKKPTTKSTKSPAPATKPAIAKTPLASKPAVTKIKAAVPPSVIVKPAAPKPVVTTITALIDVGYGNTLFVRGEGPGLNWDKGVALDVVGTNRWTIALPESTRPIVFKFLLNDVSWSAGDDFTVAPGTSLSVTPVF
jgi:hypothetical protein